MHTHIRIGTHCSVGQDRHNFEAFKEYQRRDILENLDINIKKKKKAEEMHEKGTVPVVRGLVAFCSLA